MFRQGIVSTEICTWPSLLQYSHIYRGTIAWALSHDASLVDRFLQQQLFNQQVCYGPQGVLMHKMAMQSLLRISVLCGYG